MDAPGAPNSTAARAIERERLVSAHHEICTALTVFCSNVALVRIQLRDAALPDGGTPMRAHLAELEEATQRLRDLAREMKQWHDGLVNDALNASATGAAERAKPLVQ